MAMLFRKFSISLMLFLFIGSAVSCSQRASYSDPQVYVAKYLEHETYNSENTERENYSYQVRTSDFIVANELISEVLISNCSDTKERLIALSSIVEIVLKLDREQLKSVQDEGLTKESFFVNESDECLFVHEVSTGKLSPYQTFILRFNRPIDDLEELKILFPLQDSTLHIPIGLDLEDLPLLKLNCV
jgi:hypothetical protein